MIDVQPLSMIGNYTNHDRFLMAVHSYRVCEVDGTTSTVTIPSHLPPTVKTLASEVAKKCKVHHDNVRLIVRGVVCDDRAQLSNVVTSPDDFFIANIIYPARVSPKPSIPPRPEVSTSNVQRLMEMGVERSRAEHLLRQANGDLQRAANSLKFP
jgi:hypothetical protein